MSSRLGAPTQGRPGRAVLALTLPAVLLLSPGARADDPASSVQV